MVVVVALTAAVSPFSSSDKTTVKQLSVKVCLIAVLENVLIRLRLLWSIPGVFLCLSIEHTRSKTGKVHFQLLSFNCCFVA